MRNDYIRRNGEYITRTMLDVLRRLEAVADCDVKFLALEDVSGRTLAALMRRDYVVKSSKVLHPFQRKEADNPPVMWRITSRGRKAYKRFSTPSQSRSDGICPTCGERERHVTKNGKRNAYCLLCSRESGRRKYALFGYQKKHGQLCPICGERERHVMPSGQIRAYCQPCRREREKAKRKERNARDLARIQAGEFLPCYRCKTRCRHVYGSTVSDYCHECQVQYQREYCYENRYK